MVWRNPRLPLRFLLNPACSCRMLHKPVEKVPAGVRSLCIHTCLWGHSKPFSMGLDSTYVQFPLQTVIHKVPAVMHEQVQIEAAAAIARQEHAPPGPKIPAVAPLLGEICSAWILAPHLQHDKVEAPPKITIYLHKTPIDEPVGGACASRPFD